MQITLIIYIVKHDMDQRVCVYRVTRLSARKAVPNIKHTDTSRSGNVSKMNERHADSLFFEDSLLRKLPNLKLSWSGMVILPSPENTQVLQMWVWQTQKENLK